MAAGASSPELFSSIVSLFITHSSLGLGTIVGSEIFNQLIICAGAVYASKTGTLKLDKVIVTREVGFYALGIILLYIALRDVKMDPDDPDGPEHIYVSFFDASLLFGGYLLYVACCANMERITEWVGVKEPSAGQDDVVDESTPLRITQTGVPEPVEEPIKDEPEESEDADVRVPTLLSLKGTKF